MSAFLDRDGNVQACRLKTQLVGAGERGGAFVTVNIVVAFVAAANLAALAFVHALLVQHRELHIYHCYHLL